jgi:hypothetical protein
LPDGIFSDQKSQFGYIWQGLETENIGLFCGHLFCFVANCSISSPFGIFLVVWDTFPRFGMLYHEKSGNPALKLACCHWTTGSNPTTFEFTTTTPAL